MSLTHSPLPARNPLWKEVPEASCESLAGPDPGMRGREGAETSVLTHTCVCVCARPGTHVPAPVTSLQTEPQTADQHLRLCPQTNVSPPSFHRNSRTVTCGSPPLKIIVSRNLFVTEVFRFANPLMKNLCFVL